MALRYNKTIKKETYNEVRLLKDHLNKHIVSGVDRNYFICREYKYDHGDILPDIIWPLGAFGIKFIPGFIYGTAFIYNNATRPQPVDTYNGEKLYHLIYFLEHYKDKIT